MFRKVSQHFVMPLDTGNFCLMSAISPKIRASAYRSTNIHLNISLVFMKQPILQPADNTFRHDPSPKVHIHPVWATAHRLALCVEPTQKRTADFPVILP
jgi:hypothetical protein